MKFQRSHIAERRDMALVIATMLANRQRVITDRAGIVQDLFRLGFDREVVWSHYPAAISWAAGIVRGQR